MKPLRIAVLISGGGTTLSNLIEHQRRGLLPVEFALVISSNAKARGLQYAADAGIESVVVSRRNCADAGEHRRLGQELEQNSAFSCSDRLFQADLACTFRYRYQHNIHNTDTADQKRNARDPDQLLVRALA